MVIVNEAKYRYGKEAGSFPIIKNTIFTGHKDKDKVIKSGIILFWIPFLALSVILSILAGEIISTPIGFGAILFFLIVLISKIASPCEKKLYEYIDQSVQGDLNTFGMIGAVGSIICC